MKTIQEVMELSRKIAWEEISRECAFKCKCGQLATGYHEAHCSKFQKSVDVRQRFVLRDAGFYKEPLNVEQVKINLNAIEGREVKMSKKILEK